MLVFEEPDRRFSLGTGSTRDTAFVLVGLHSTNTTEWLAIPSDDPLAEPAGRHAPRAKGSSTPSTTSRPRRAGGSGWFVVLTNDDAQDFRVLAAPDTGPGSGHAGRRGARWSRTGRACGSRTSTPSPAPSS